MLTPTTRFYAITNFSSTLNLKYCHILFYYCPLKLWAKNKKGLIPFCGISPNCYLCLYHKTSVTWTKVHIFSDSKRNGMKAWIKRLKEDMCGNAFFGSVEKQLRYISTDPNSYKPWCGSADFKRQSMVSWAYNGYCPNAGGMVSAYKIPYRRKGATCIFLF